MGRRRKRGKEEEEEEEEEEEAKKETKKRKRMSSIEVRAHDTFILEMHNKNYKASEIAVMLCEKKDLNPELWDRKRVEGRIRDMRQKKQGMFAPVNPQHTNLQGESEPTKICLTFFLFFLFLISLILLFRAKSSRPNCSGSLRQPRQSR